MTDQELLERILLNARIVDGDMKSETIMRSPRTTRIPNYLRKCAEQLATDILEWVRRRPELQYQERIAELERELAAERSKKCVHELADAKFAKGATQ